MPASPPQAKGKSEGKCAASASPLHRGLRHRALGKRVGSLGAGSVVGIRRSPGQSGRHNRDPDGIARQWPGTRGPPSRNWLPDGWEFRQPVRSIHGDTDKGAIRHWAPTARAPPRSACPRSSRHGKVEAKAKKIGRHQLEASRTDIVIENGEFQGPPAPTSRSRCRCPRSRLHRAQSCPRHGAGSEGRRVLRSDQLHLSGPAPICELEVDTGTGRPPFRPNFRPRDDFGRLINPMIRRGTGPWRPRPGIGQALLEGAVYDATVSYHRVVHWITPCRAPRPAVVQAEPHHDACARAIRSVSKARRRAGAIALPPP